MERQMNKLSVLQNVYTVFKHPYPHVCVDQALPDSVYTELQSTFPEYLICETQPHDGGSTYRYKSNPASKSPARVPMTNPSSGVNPMLVSILLPYSTSQTEAPLPRLHVIIFKSSIGVPKCSATC